MSDEDQQDGPVRRVAELPVGEEDRAADAIKEAAKKCDPSSTFRRQTHAMGRFDRVIVEFTSAEAADNYKSRADLTLAPKLMPPNI